MNCAIQKPPPFVEVLLLDAKRIGCESFAFEVLVPQARLALQVGAAFCFAAAALMCFGVFV
jgi:hypothetical protein